MSLANAELLLQGKDISADDFINKWLQTYQRDPGEGYSRYMQKLMGSCKTPEEFSRLIDATKGKTSGAAMRAGVLGLLGNIEEIKSLTLRQARITHDTPAGINSALSVALSVHFLHHGGTRNDLQNFIKGQLSSEWNSIENGYTTEPLTD